MTWENETMQDKVLEMCREVNADIPPDPETKLFDDGWIDSFGAYMILAQLELEYDIEISETLMNYENFKDVNSICKLIDAIMMGKK